MTTSPERRGGQDTASFLSQIVHDTARKVGVSATEITPAHARYFVPVVTKDGFACGDDRPVIGMIFDSFQVIEHNGPQMVGAAYGLVDCLYMLTDSRDDRHPAVAENTVRRALNRLGMPFTAHIENHGKSVDGLVTEFKGCGYLDIVATSPWRVGVDRPIDHQTRVHRLRENGDVIHVVNGGHKPTAALINMDPAVSFQTSNAYHEGKGAFNCDVGFIYNVLAPEIAMQLRNDKRDAIPDFPQRYAAKVVEVYLRTVQALAPQVPFQINGGQYV